MKKSKPVIKLYKLEIFPYDTLTVIVVDDYSQLKNMKFSDSKGPVNLLDHISDSTDALTLYNIKYKDDWTMIIILNRKWINASEKRSSCYVENTITHESVHAAYEILKTAGITLSSETEEAYAYLSGWISQCVSKTYKNK